MMTPEQRRRLRRDRESFSAMTVCIAAVCHSGDQSRPPMVVAAADRMITIDGIGYEPAQRKMVQLAGLTLGLLAGNDMQLHAAVVPKITPRLELEVSQRDDKRVTVEEIAKMYADEFAIYLRERVEREILAKRNLTYDKFYLRRHDMPHYQMKEIDDLISSYQIESSALIVGLDHTGAHIYRITSPGIAESFDTPFFACIGSGAPLASVPFMLAQYSRSWPLERALLLAFSAKTRAEETTNVGTATDLAVITSAGIIYLADEELAKLREILERQITEEKRAEQAAYTEVEVYIRSHVNQATSNSSEQTTSEPEKKTLPPQSTS